MKNYPKKSFAHAIVAVDVVLFTVIRDELSVLVLKLKEQPFAGKWALPGGLVTSQENLEEAAKRHLKEKAGASHIHLEQLYTFGDPGRDPHGWVVSTAYLALVPYNQFTPKTSDRYEKIEWSPVENIENLAYDHKEIIKMAQERLQAKLTYTNIAYSLLEQTFTLTQLQQLYESILGKSLDNRNFRKKILSLGIIKAVSKKTAGEANRPAQLYSFRTKTPKIVEIL